MPNDGGKAGLRRSSKPVVFRMAQPAHDETSPTGISTGRRGRQPIRATARLAGRHAHGCRGHVFQKSQHGRVNATMAPATPTLEPIGSLSMGPTPPCRHRRIRTIRMANRSRSMARKPQRFVVGAVLPTWNASILQDGIPTRRIVKRLKTLTSSFAS
jgi:hypothetical protein